MNSGRSTRASARTGHRSTPARPCQPSEKLNVRGPSGIGPLWIRCHGTIRPATARTSSPQTGIRRSAQSGAPVAVLMVDTLRSVHVYSSDVRGRVIAEVLDGANPRVQPIDKTRGTTRSASSEANSTGCRSGISITSVTPSLAYSSTSATKASTSASAGRTAQTVFSTSSKARFSASQCPRRTSNLRSDLLHRRTEHVAGVAVTGHQAQSLLLAATANHDRWSRPAEWSRHAERLGELVMLPGERTVVVAPHLQTDPQGLLEPLEPLGHRHHRDAQTALLPFVPGGADAQPAAAAGQHVESGHGLREHPRVGGTSPR